MNDIELELAISWVAGRDYQASIRSPYGRGTRPFSLTEGSTILADPETGSPDAQRDVQRRVPAADLSPLALLRAQGMELSRLVFGGDNEAPFKKCLDEAEAKQAWLRIRLIFRKAPAAADWPWEALVVPWSGQFLANQPRVSIERLFEISQKPRLPWRTATDSLRILVVGASPTDMTKVSVDAEKRRMARAFKDAGVPVEIKGADSPATLSKATSRKAPYDIVHVVCHGDFEDNQGGVWLIGGADRQGSRISSGELPGFLKRPSALVFLNVCHSGRSSRDPFAGLAEALIRAGSLSVVAMRRPVSDEGAVLLAQTFYQHLARGETVAKSLAEWREASPRDDADWAVPVLYLADDDFPVWTQPPAEPAVDEKRGRWKRILRRWWKPAALAGASLAAAAITWYAWPAPPCPRPTVISDRRCPDLGDFDLSLAFIEQGAFEQGSDTGFDAEKPVHPVTLTADFCLGVFEVTRGQFARATGKRPSARTAWLPQEKVYWPDTQTFVEAISRRFPETHCYLPTEAQWEYAARAGRRGDEPRSSPEPANCEGEGDPFVEASCVGSFPANAWGLYDMKGNVWEWTQDRDSRYPATALVDPRGPEVGQERIRRGGSYANPPSNCRFTTRNGLQPTRKQQAAGFRIACDPVGIAGK